MDNKSDSWEGQFIEVSGTSLKKKLIIGNVYRPPINLTENHRTFTNDLIPRINSLCRPNGEVVIAGDINIDLLKINAIKNLSNCFDTITVHSFFQTITLHTWTNQHCLLTLHVH